MGSDPVSLSGRGSFFCFVWFFDTHSRTGILTRGKGTPHSSYRHRSLGHPRPDGWCEGSDRDVVGVTGTGQGAGARPSPERENDRETGRRRRGSVTDWVRERRKSRDTGPSGAPVRHFILRGGGSADVGDRPGKRVGRRTSCSTDPEGRSPIETLPAKTRKTRNGVRVVRTGPPTR